MDRFQVENGGSVWVDRDGTWETATLVEVQTKTVTKFEKVQGEGFKRVDSEVKSAVLRSDKKEMYDGPLSNPDNVSLPAVVIWLVFGAIFFTFRMGFISTWFLACH